ncbi:blh_monoox, beta-carotene 15,15'-monooxygenase, Brp/Blh family [Methylophilaceae bacterium]
MAKYLILQSNIFMVVTIVTIALFYLGLGNTSTTNVLALILIITFFGVPHGALDTLFAKKAFALNSIKKWLQFVSVYLSLSIGVLIFWMVLPTFFFILFLCFSAIHFSDDLGSINPKLLGTLYGFNIITLPSILHSNELAKLYGYLIDYGHAVEIVNVMMPFSIVFAALTILITVVISLKKYPIEQRHIWEIVAVSVLMLLAEPLLAFTIYFCFMHSARHVLRAKFYFVEYSNTALLITLIVPTLIVLLFCAGVFQLLPIEKFNENLIKVTFATLSALTLPHAFLLSKVGFLKWLKSH